MKELGDTLATLKARSLELENINESKVEAYIKAQTALEKELQDKESSEKEQQGRVNDLEVRKGELISRIEKEKEACTLIREDTREKEMKLKSLKFTREQLIKTKVRFDPSMLSRVQPKLLLTPV